MALDRQKLRSSVQKMRGSTPLDDASVMGEPREETKTDISQTIITMPDGQTLKAFEMVGAYVIEWLEESGHTFDLSEDGSTLFLNPNPNELEAWVLKDNAADVKRLLAIRRDKLANEVWDDEKAISLVMRSYDDLKRIKPMLGKISHGAAKKMAFNSLAKALELTASSLRDGDMESVWRTSEWVRQLVDEMRDWAKDKNNLPPKEIIADSA